MLLKDAKFSLWCDFLERDFLESGFTALLKEEIINGVTSNPAIFKSAFLTSPAYKEDIEALKEKDAKTIYEALAVQDIQKSADIMKDLYKKSDDGFVSIEVDPFLCDNSKGTIEEAQRLYKMIDRENVMIKIPATKEGFIAMENLIAEGININATLIFSPEQAVGCLDAFEKGLEQFARNDSGKKTPQAVISIFVSRFDRKMDASLFSRNIKGGLVGIMNATKIYNQIEERAIPNVRALFASTGVKGDVLPKDYYITNLLYQNCVNTAPLETINAFVENKDFSVQTPLSNEEIDYFFDVVKNQGFDMSKVYDELMGEGLEAFKNAFKEILRELKGN